MNSFSIVIYHTTFYGCVSFLSSSILIFCYLGPVLVLRVLAISSRSNKLSSTKRTTSTGSPVDVLLQEPSVDFQQKETKISFRHHKNKK
jgi:hypothetical protein